MSATNRAAPPRNLGWQAAWSLAKREGMRFFRQRNRVIGAVGQPILFWLLFAAGMNRMFRIQDQSFGEYYFPGTVVLVLLFTAIFATISIIEDRREGFLQSVLVAPAPRWSMVLGKILGGAGIALLQSLLMLILAIFIEIRFSLAGLTLTLLWLFVSAIGMTGLGFVLAWRMESTQGFHAIMNLLLMPLWLLSGAFFPIPNLHGEATWVEWGMHWVMRLNPVSYMVSGLRQLLYWNDPPALAALKDAGVWIPPLWIGWIVVTGFAAATFLASVKLAQRHTTGDLL